MKLASVILMVAVSINLTGCFSSNPSESDAKGVVLGGFKKYIDSGDVVVENFKKKDGIEMGQGEFKMYDMSVDITLKFPKGINCELTPTNYQHVDTNKCSTLKMNFSKPIAPGASYAMSRTVRFIKSETGWHGGLQ